jgi:Trk K+ transport system NAD-binding subunit
VGGRRFVITGVSRLSVRVARALTEAGADVVLVAGRNADDDLTSVVGRVATVRTEDVDRATSLRAAGLAEADGLLALDDDDLDNLRTVGCAAAVAPDVPVVLRSFDAALADRVELGSNVRRAFSLSALAAPAFVAAAIGDDALATLRLGDDEVPLVQLVVGDAGPLAGHRPSAIAARTEVVVVARRTPGAEWAPAHDDAPLAPAEEVVVGGHLRAVLAAALANDPLPAPPKRRRRRATFAELRRRPQGLTSTLLPVAVLLLAVVLVAATAYFSAVRDLGAADALYFTVTAGLGNADLIGEGIGQQLAGIALIVAFGALIGIVFSYVATVAVAHRSGYRMERQAARRRGHVVVVGVGTIGYRVLSLLDDLGIDTTAIEQSASSRFLGAAAAHGPVLVGNARLPEELERTGVEHAACLVAVTDDDLVNISACLQARAVNPTIRTVARIFDETIAEHAGSALGIDVALSGSRSAAAAFAGAALEDRAPRHVHLGSLELVAFRHPLPVAPTAVDLETWRAEGAHLVATDDDSPTGIVCGPAGSPIVQALLAS